MRGHMYPVCLNWRLCNDTGSVYPVYVATLTTGERRIRGGEKGRSGEESYVSYNETSLKTALVSSRMK